MTAVRGVFVVAEEAGESPDEGYAKVVIELGRAMERHGTVVTHVTPRAARRSDRGPESRIQAGVRRMRAVTDRRLRSLLVEAQPSTVVYMSRSSVTLSALVRSRLLKSTAQGARVVMIALQPRRMRWPSTLVSRLLWPDLLLVSTTDELHETRGRGARVDRMMTGVDLDRFRPAQPGEKTALREKWGIPIDTNVVLHVGHLTEGRNLDALLPLADQSGLTVVVVTSGQRERASERIQKQLRAVGVVLIQGFLPDISEIYRLADCYVFPTASTDYAIAMPLSILEAMASDLPIAAMRVGALPEQFGNADGVMLVDSPEELIEAVAHLLREPQSTRRLSERYSWAAVAEQVAGV